MQLVVTPSGQAGSFGLFAPNWRTDASESYAVLPVPWATPRPLRMMAGLRPILPSLAVVVDTGFAAPYTGTRRSALPTWLIRMRPEASDRYCRATPSCVVSIVGSMVWRRLSALTRMVTVAVTDPRAGTLATRGKTE